MDKKYLKRFLIVVGCLLILTIGTAYYYKSQPSTFIFDDFDFVTLDMVDTVFFHHSLEVDTYSSSNAQELKKFYSFLDKIETKNTKDFEETNSYYEVIFSGNNNFYRKSYKFYNNGYVEVTENAGFNSKGAVYKLKDEEDLDRLITMFRQD